MGAPKLVRLRRASKATLILIECSFKTDECGRHLAGAGKCDHKLFGTFLNYFCNAELTRLTLSQYCKSTQAGLFREALSDALMRPKWNRTIHTVVCSTAWQSASHQHQPSARWQPPSLGITSHQPAVSQMA